MTPLIYRGKSAKSKELVTGMLTTKNRIPYINKIAVEPATIDVGSTYFDRNHTQIFENDFVAKDDLVYRVVYNPILSCFGKLLLFDLVRHSDNVIALKLHKPLIPLGKLAGHVEEIDREFARSSEIIGDLHSFVDKAQMIDVSKASGDKEAYIDNKIKEMSANK